MGQVTTQKHKLRQQYNAMVSRAIQKVRRDYRGLTPCVVDHLHYGAVDIHPRLLVIWLLYKNAAALSHAETKGHTRKIQQGLLEALAAEGYPEDALPSVKIGFEDKQAVDAVGAWNYFR